MRNARWYLSILAVLGIAFGCDSGDSGDSDNETPAPAIVVFEATPSSVEAGKSVTLRWVTQDATSIRLLEGDDAVDLGGAAPEAGQIVLTPLATTSYTLEASSGGKSATQSVSVEVLEDPEDPIDPTPEPTIARFEASMTQVTKGAGTEVRLSWEVEGAETLSLESEPGGAVPLSSTATEVKVTVDETTRFVLSATNDEGTATKELVVEALPAPTIVRFESSVGAAAPDAPFTLSWEVEGAEELSLLMNGLEIAADELEPTGSFEVTIESASVFILVATNAVGTAVESDEVSVGLLHPPEIIDFAVDPSRAGVGQAVILSWRVDSEDAFEISITDDLGEPVDVEGLDPGSDEISVVVERTGVLTFTLTAASAGLTVSDSTSVEVFGPPNLSFWAEPTDFNPNDMEEALLVWEAPGAESLSLFAYEDEDTLNETPIYVATGAEAVSGSFGVAPGVTTRYRAVATNPVRQEEVKEATITVEVPSVLLFTGTFRDKSSFGIVIDLEWETSGGMVDLTMTTDPGRVEEHSTTLLQIVEEGAYTFGKPEELKPDDCPSLEKASCADVSFPQGFAFPFDGEQFTQARLFSTGFVSFDTDPFQGGDTGEQSEFPAAHAPFVHIASLWTQPDVLPFEKRGLFWEMGQERNQRVLYLSNVEAGAGTLGETKNFQVALFEDGTFDLRYGAMTPKDKSSPHTGLGSMGWQNLDATIGGQANLEDMDKSGGAHENTFRYVRHKEGKLAIKVWSGEAVFDLCVENKAGTRVCETRKVGLY